MLDNIGMNRISGSQTTGNRITCQLPDIWPSIRPDILTHIRTLPYIRQDTEYRYRIYKIPDIRSRYPLLIWKNEWIPRSSKEHIWWEYWPAVLPWTLVILKYIYSIRWEKLLVSFFITISFITTLTMSHAVYLKKVLVIGGFQIQISKCSERG